MSTSKTIYRSVSAFIQAIHLSSKIRFLRPELEAEIFLINRRTREEEIKIIYKWNGTPFSFCQSPKAADIIQDFKYQCKIFGVC